MEEIEILHSMQSYYVEIYYFSYILSHTKLLEKEVVVITMCFIDEQNCEGVKLKPLDVDPCSDVFSLGCHISGLSHLLFNKKCT